MSGEADVEFERVNGYVGLNPTTCMVCFAIVSDFYEDEHTAWHVKAGHVAAGSTT